MTMDIAADLLDWHEALDCYSYPVDLREFSGGGRFPGWFDLNLEKGDRSETIQFETRFRECAASCLEPWYEVVFWKMFLRVGLANEQTERTIQRLKSNKNLASTLWARCAEYVQSETKASFKQFKDLLIEWDSIAVAFTFAAFSCPSRFPMVDTRIARYVACEAPRLGFPIAPKIDKTLRRYRASGDRVLTLSDWPFVEAWVRWCRDMAARLSAHKKHGWRARDVEMAVFRAWGERKERKSCSEGPRYKLIDKLAQGQETSSFLNAQT
jgi:hypothetical protein